MKTASMRTSAAVLVVLAIASVSNGALIAYYNFGTSSPSTANQGTLGTVADGILNGGATIVDIDPDARGVEYALHLDNAGVTGWANHARMNITNGDDSWFDNATGNDGQGYTIAAWIKQPTNTTSGWVTLVSKGYESAFHLATDTAQGDPGQVVFAAHCAFAAWEPLKGTTDVRSDTYWYHVAATVDNVDHKTAALYINSVLQDSRQEWCPTYTNDVDILIGDEPNRTGWDFAWNGYIDEVRIYDYALDDTEVYDLFINGCSPVYGCTPCLACPVSLEITGQEQVQENSQVQYTATAMMEDSCTHLIVPMDVTEEAIWWVVPDTFASIDANGLLTIGNIDTPENITIHAQYTECVITVEEAMEILCMPTTYHVDGLNGDNSNDGLTRATAFETIQYAINTAADYDIVLVWPGVYTESLYFIDQAITVKSAADAAILEATGSNAVSFYTSESQDTVLANFVIRDSNTGIFVSTGTPTISNITLVDNDLGIEAENGAEPNITNCVFWGNDYDLYRDPVPLTAQYSFVQEDLEEDLISYWKLDGNAIDSAGGNDGTIYGAVPAIGQVNGALEFNGNDDYADCGNDPSLFGMSELTIGAWIYPRSAGESGFGRIVANDVSPRSYALYIEAGNNVCFTVHAFGGVGRIWSTDNPATYNKWHYVVGTYGESQMRIYVDGTERPKETNSLASGTVEAGSAICIGDGGRGDRNFDGLIDDVRIYDRALSADEIAQFYKIGLAGREFEPLFADPNNDDYHLLSERGRYWPVHDVWVLDDVSSPCIDGGNPNVDPSNEPTPNGGRINMGAYGNTAYASMSKWLIASDINLDGVVNLVDFAILAQDWLEVMPWAQ
ncbi:MAG: LamG domain-containing protein [Planctomycetota bacterium]|jgi:hypothetical protein